MELHFLPIISFLSIVLVVGQAALPTENYWKKVLPNTPMPNAVRNSLPQPEWMEDKGTSVNVGKGGVHVNTGGAKPGGTTMNVGPHKGVAVNTGKPAGGGHTNVNVGKGGVGVSTGKPGGGHTNVNVGPKGGVGVNTGKPGKGGAHVGVGKGGVVVHAGPKKKPVYVGVKPGPNPFTYNYAASETQLKDGPTKALFFLKKDMRPGSKMTLQFTRSTNKAMFLPREQANSLSFSSRKIPVKPGSDEARTIEQTVRDCERKGISGEEKYCATSLESMVDYTTSSLGSHVRAVSTEAAENEAPKEFVITGVRKVGTATNAVVCHKQNYAYAVFYCHRSTGTSAYAVSLASGGGGNAAVKAVAVCHEDTSGWNPKHLAFQVLKVKPGSVPICHFLPEDHIVWVQN